MNGPSNRRLAPAEYCAALQAPNDGGLAEQADPPRPDIDRKIEIGVAERTSGGFIGHTLPAPACVPAEKWLGRRDARGLRVPARRRQVAAGPDPRARGPAGPVTAVRAIFRERPYAVVTSFAGPYPSCGETNCEGSLLPVQVDPEDGNIVWRCSACHRRFPDRDKETREAVADLSRIRRARVPQ